MNNFFNLPNLTKREVKSLGDESYVLSRLEYLEIKFNALIGCLQSTDGLTLFSSALPEMNTLLLIVTHLPEVDEETVNYHVDVAREWLSENLRLLDWEQWVKIDVVVNGNVLSIEE